MNEISKVVQMKATRQIRLLSIYQKMILERCKPAKNQQFTQTKRRVKKSINKQSKITTIQTITYLCEVLKPETLLWPDEHKLQASNVNQNESLSIK